jgi:hypothetical protein
VFIGTPFRETGKPLEDTLRIGMEDMRAVGMDEYSVGIIGVVGIPANVRTLVKDNSAMSGFC